MTCSCFLLVWETTPPSAVFLRSVDGGYLHWMAEHSLIIVHFLLEISWWHLSSWRGGLRDGCSIEASCLVGTFWTVRLMILDGELCHALICTLAEPQRGARVRCLALAYMIVAALITKALNQQKQKNWWDTLFWFGGDVMKFNISVKS